MTIYELIKSMNKVHMTDFFFNNFTSGGNCKKCAFRPHEDGRENESECYEGHCRKVILEWIRKELT